MYRLADYTAFQGDQGTDALVVKRLLVEHQLVLEGPATSAGGVHLGPAYYYLLALPMMVKWLDPLADAFLMALLGGAAVGIVFVLARRWFGLWPAVVAAGLYALSPAAIVAAQSAWNPAPAPFFAGLAILGLDQARRSGHGGWLLMVGLALGVLIQLHYFAAAIVVVLLACTAFPAPWSAAECGVVRQHPRLRAWAIGGLGLFTLLQAPLLVHELLTGFPNVQAALALGKGGSFNGSESVLRRLFELFSLGLVGGFLTANIEPLAAAVSLVLACGLGAQLVARRPPISSLHLWGRAGGEGGVLAEDRRWLWGAGVLIAVLLVATVAQGIVYRGPIFAHYWLAISPVLFLAVAAGVSIVPRTPPAIVAASLGVLALLGLNIWASPLRDPPERQLARSEAVAQAIASAAGSEPFSVMLTTPGESASAYRFQLERIDRPPAAADAPEPALLFVINPANDEVLQLRREEPFTPAETHEGLPLPARGEGRGEG